MTGSARRFLWLLALLAPSVPASGSAPAQDPAGQTAGQSGEIVVTGARDRDEAIHDYVEAITVDTDDQLARFAAPICPASFGLPAGHNEVIAARVRRIADHVGIGSARPGCRPNVVIVIAESGGDFVRHLHGERPDLFSALETSAIRRVLRAEGPVRAWQVIEPRGADGRPMERISFLEMGGGPPRPVLRGYVLRGVSPSLTQKATRQDLALSFIVLDLDAVEGLTLLQIADYAAMRALARTEAAAPSRRRSILSLLDDRDAGDAPADGLTDWDAAYLTALYRTGNTVTASQQRANMARTMMRALDER
jgi:hypothetical protein